jgi:hypothetical protein
MENTVKLSTYKSFTSEGRTSLPATEGEGVRHLYTVTSNAHLATITSPVTLTSGK